MDRSVSALINFGAIDCWTKPGTRVTGIGITLGHGSWPIQPGWDKTRATGNIVVWPNPDVGTVRENPGRFALGAGLFDFGQLVASCHVWQNVSNVNLNRRVCTPSAEHGNRWAHAGQEES